MNPFLTKWDTRFIRIAEEVKTWSKDPDKKVGCVLVRDNRDISKGYNGLPKGISDDLSRLKDPYFKGKVIIHAEENAILNAARYGVNTEGSTAYVTFHPCASCASKLIQAGIVKIICPSPETTRSNKWRENFKTSSDILLEAGVLVLYYTSRDES